MITKMYYDIFDEQGLQYKNDEGMLPLTVNGCLKPGIFKLPGDVSSQFVSGLMFALPLLEGDSVIEITSPLESASYVDLTLSCLKKYGISVENVNGEHRKYIIPGKQKYLAQQAMVEADWSQAAFWLVGGSLGEQIDSTGISMKTLQGDKAVVDMKPGDVTNIHLMPDEAYGPSNPNMILRTPISQLPGSEDLKVGEKVLLSNQFGQPIPVVVIEKTEDMIALDANHEMAGKELNFKIELVDILEE